MRGNPFLDFHRRGGGRHGESPAGPWQLRMPHTSAGGVRSAVVCALRGDVNIRTGEHAGPGPGATEIVAWRSKRLRKAGFDNRLAEQLSRECAADLHALIELVERGCPPPLAARILAPLEHERIGC